MHSACAVAIGALTYNKTAFRLLYNLVRRDPSMILSLISFSKKLDLSSLFLALYDKIVDCGQRSCMSPEFVTFFESERAKGLPVDRYCERLKISIIKIYICFFIAFLFNLMFFNLDRPLHVSDSIEYLFEFLFNLKFVVDQQWLIVKQLHLVLKLPIVVYKRRHHRCAHLHQISTPNEALQFQRNRLIHNKTIRFSLGDFLNLSFIYKHFLLQINRYIYSSVLFCFSLSFIHRFFGVDWMNRMSILIAVNSMETKYFNKYFNDQNKMIMTY